jgi:hypothetical protein
VVLAHRDLNSASAELGYEMDVTVLTGTPGIEIILQGKDAGGGNEVVENVQFLLNGGAAPASSSFGTLTPDIGNPLRAVYVATAGGGLDSVSATADGHEGPGFVAVTLGDTINITTTHPDAVTLVAAVNQL